MHTPGREARACALRSTRNPRHPDVRQAAPSADRRAASRPVEREITNDS